MVKDDYIMNWIAKEAKEALECHPTDWFVICGQDSINIIKTKRIKNL